MTGRTTFSLHRVPPPVWSACGCAATSKRQVDIRLSSGQRLFGFGTIGIGRAVHIPAHLWPHFRAVEWAEFEIVGDQTGEEVTLAPVRTDRRSTPS